MEKDADLGVRGTSSCDNANTQVVGLTALGSVPGLGAEVANEFFERAEWMVRRDSRGGGGGNWLLEEDAMLQALDLMVMGECVIRDGLAVLQRRGDMLYKTRKIEMRSSRK